MGDRTALIDPEQALELVLTHAPAPRPRLSPLPEAVGRVLLEPVVARVAQPPFSRSMMDGYAVVVADAGATVTCGGEVAAGDAAETAVGPGRAVAIMTGAPCPPGTEAVVKVEDASRQGDQVTLPGVIVPGQHVQPQGLLCQPGDTVLPAGTELTSVSLAAAISVGAGEAVVATPPTLAIISTGNELARPGAALSTAQIYDSNGPMLEALARQAGAGAIQRLHAGDTRESLRDTLEQAAAADIVVLSGGVSMGRYDLVPEVLESLGWERVFHKARQKPGKPLFFAHRGEALVFGLPGTPLGSHLGFHRYVAAAIRKALGWPTLRPTHLGRLAEPLTCRSRRILFRLARAERQDTTWQVYPLRWGGSSDLVGPARANAYLRLEPGEHRLAAGTELPFEFLDGAGRDHGF